MKKIIALMLLGTTCQAKLPMDLNVSRHKRTMAGGKTLFAGYLTYAAARHVNEVWKKGAKLLEGKLKENAEILPRQGVVIGLSAYTTYLLLKQTLHEAAHTLGGKEKENVVDAWHNSEKDSNVKSLVKALLAGSFCCAALRQLFLQGAYLYTLKTKGWESVYPAGWNRLDWNDYCRQIQWNIQKQLVINALPGKFFIMVVSAVASYAAFKEAWHNAKCAIIKDKKETQISR